MARGGISVFTSLLVIFISILVFLAILRGLLLYFVPEAEIQRDEHGFWSNVYIIFLQLTDPGNMNQDIESSPWYKLVAILSGIAGVIMLSSLVAFITTALHQKLNDLRRGRSKVIETGHTLILGWDEQRVVEILRELVLANRSESNACVVILSAEEKVYMDDIIRLRIPNLYTTRVVTRTGNTTTMANLDIVSVQTCKSVIILAECDEMAPGEVRIASDARVIQTVLAVNCTRKKQPGISIVVEMFNPVYRQIVRDSFPDNVVTINTENILARIMVQTSRSVGLSVVYNELLSFDGCEMYFYKNRWGDITFGEILFRFVDGVPIGLLDSDGKVQLNPDDDRKLTDDDTLLILANDDSTIKYRRSSVAEGRDLELAGGRNERHIEKELILGWTSKVPIIIKEYSDYVTTGSCVDVMVNGPSAEIQEAVDKMNLTLPGIEINLVDGDQMNSENLLQVEPFSYDNIIILAEGELGASAHHVDSGNIVTLLLLREIFRNHAQEAANTRLITEVLDSQNYEMVYNTGVKDVIISNRMISMLLAQISESRRIKQVYDVLFQAQDAEIYIKPTGLYFDPLPLEVTFGEMMMIARKRGEVCIGVKIKAHEDDADKNYGVILNPDKQRKFALQITDALIVVAEDES